MEQEETIPTGALLLGGGCALLPLALAAFVMITVFNWLSSCGELPPPTPEEQARIDAENAREERSRLAFESQQKVLWAQPSAFLTRDTVVKEVIKCQEQIEKANPSPYVWRYEWDGEEALRQAKEYSAVTLTSQNRKDVPFIDNNVETTEYTCRFKGAGYESFSQSGQSTFSSSYLPD